MVEPASERLVKVLVDVWTPNRGTLDQQVLGSSPSPAAKTRLEIVQNAASDGGFFAPSRW